MPKIRIGLQTITYGDPQYDYFDSIFNEAKECGYDGVEVGYRRLAPIDPGHLRTLLRKNGIELIASHIGGNLVNEEQAQSEHTKIDMVLNYLQHVSTNRLVVSGVRNKSENGYRRFAESLRKLIEIGNSRLFEVLYHNHEWEFANGTRYFEILQKTCGTHLYLCPDVGWLCKAGIDPRTFLQDHKSHIGAVHFKDFLSMNAVCDTVELGEGVVPLRECAEILKDFPGDTLWVIAEQDNTTIGAPESVKRNSAFLHSCFK